jgi:hypothetical protein
MFRCRAGIYFFSTLWTGGPSHNSPPHNPTDRIAKIFMVELGTPASRSIYLSLLASARTLGPYSVEVKKTCVHLVRATAFAGVHFRKEHLLITVKAAQAIASPRVFRTLQASKQRWYVDVKLHSAAELDAELMAWMRGSYELSL